MALYSKDSLLRLRERVDLVEVLSKHLPLKRMGASFKTHCPFHEEKTPSFIVKRTDRHYHCFGCGAHGDAIEFLMRHLNFSFTEAVEALAEQFQVVLEKEHSEEAQGPSKAKLKEALAVASSFFHFFLLKTAHGADARAYLSARGIGAEFIERFEIGLAPQSGELFSKFMREKKVDRELLSLVGLLTGEGRVFFRDRITFPIRSPTGSVIGFSARKFHETTFGGKYINSPETPLFKKSKVLFGLNYSRRRIAKERRVLVVEGQIDCLRLIDIGLDYTVASLGTAFTEEHVRELKSLGLLRATLLFDGDTSGRKAALKVGQLFQKQGIDAEVALLPEGEDPDSLVRAKGADALKGVFERAKEFLAFYVDESRSQYDFSQAGAKTELVRQIAGEIAEWQDPMMVHEGLKRLAALTDVPEVLLLKGYRPQKVQVAKPKPSKGPLNPDRLLECDLLRWLLFSDSSAVVQMIKEHLVSEDFLDSDCRNLFEAFFRSFEEGGSRDFLSILSRSDRSEGVAELVEELMGKKIKKIDAMRLSRISIQKILDRKWLAARERIQKEIADKGRSEAERARLVQLFDQLKNQRPEVRS